MICHHNNDNRDTGRVRTVRARGSNGAGGSGGGIALDGVGTLNKAPIFTDLPDAVKRTTARHLVWTAYTEGAVILSRAEASTQVYLLASGTAQVVNDEHAERRIIRAELNPGDIFGELAAMGTGARSSAVVARTDCVSGAMPQDVYMKIITTHETAALATMKQLTGALRAANENIESMCVLDARQRLARELSRLAETDPSDTSRRRIHRIAAQIDIADTLCMARQTVARLFGEWRRAGIIERLGDSLIIHKPDELGQIHEI